MHRRFLAACLFALGWLASATVLTAAPSLTTGRDVIVIVGVAGDVESEKNYADQLNRLLDAFSAPEAAPKSLTLLIENPAAMDRKFAFPVKVLSNRRESLLGLKGTDPDMVIAWGHGGLQGTQPVLHVPGPRVVPADLLVLAGPTPGKASDWVLYFRGSEAFAQAIGDAGRRVLASEGEKTFTYDPIGLPMLLQALPQAQNLSSLTVQTAKAVEQWYASRSLAATEQPTLWTGGKPAPEGADAATPEEGNVAAGWHGPAAVDAAAHRDVDAIVLRETVQAVIGDNPQLSQEEESYVQILTSEGKRFGDLDLAFSPPEENLTVLDCEIRHPDGSVERVDTGTHDESPEPGAPEDYPTARRKFFSVPNVVPGAILHLRLKREWKHFPLPKVYLTLPLADELPILDKQLEIRVPSALPFRFGWRNPPAGGLPDPKVESTSYGSIYRWQIGAVTALPTDPLQPPNREPALLASTFGDWSEFLSWYQGIIRESNHATPEMAAKAQELTRDCRDDLDKIRALFRYVTELRYVAVPLGVNAYRPHAAANVFHHRYGDCKDKANLLNALLVSQGFDARLVLAPRFAVALPEVPGAAFNHAISHVLVGGKSLWLDSTDDICRFGLLPPGDPGSRVLLIADKEKGLRTLPLPPAQDSRLDLSFAFKQAEGNALESSGECQATGIMDYQLRASARQIGRAKGHGNLLDGLVKSLNGAPTFTEQNFLSPAELTRDFTWKGSGRWDGLVSALPASAGAGGDAGKLVRFPFLVPGEWATALQPRTASLYLNEGYPCEIVERLNLPLGESQQADLPTGGEITAGPLQYRLQWTQTDPKTVAATLTITLQKADLTPAEVPAFQAALRNLHQTLAQGVVLHGRTEGTHP